MCGGGLLWVCVCMCVCVCLCVKSLELWVRQGLSHIGLMVGIIP